MRYVAPVAINLIDMDRWPFARVLSLVAHLQAGGTVPPIHVKRMPDGRFRILDGRHRMHAHKLLGRVQILARWGEKAQPVAR
jgi:hypothetical protein